MPPLPATVVDIPAWLTLAREVEHLFGPMADEAPFQQGLKAAIESGSAFGIRDGLADSTDTALAGAIAIDREANAVAWLAVAQASRGRGYGAELLRVAIEQLDPARPIVVQTFADDEGEGAPARRLYFRFGFQDDKPADPTPAGVPTIFMVRPPR